MLDLRFVERHVADDDKPDGYSRTVKILQVRHQTNLLELGMQEPIWSEWADVRVETEE